MKKPLIFAIFLATFLFSGCEKPSDCIESAGKTIQKEVLVTPFEIIQVQAGIELVITQGLNYKVTIETGENLIADIDVKQTGNVLNLKDNTTCNWVRQFGQTKVFVTAPNLTEINSKTEKNITSNGVLTYPLLRLIAFDSDADGKNGAGTNDFFIQINNDQLFVESNNVARFYLSGQTNQAAFNFYEGNGRIEAQNLNAQNITVFHRGSNDMIVKPIQSITGKMVSVGNIILKNNPPIVSVEHLFQGQVIYN